MAPRSAAFVLTRRSFFPFLTQRGMEGRRGEAAAKSSGGVFLLCVQLWALPKNHEPGRRSSPTSTGLSPVGRTCPAWWRPRRVGCASTVWPLWAWTRAVCSPSPWTGTWWCATVSCMAGGSSRPSWRAGATPSAAAATASCSSPCTGSTAWICSPCWTRSLPSSSTTAGPTPWWQPGTPSASAPCSTAMTTTAASSLPARPRTSLACAKRCSPSRPATTTPEASSSATPT